MKSFMGAAIVALFAGMSYASSMPAQNPAIKRVVGLIRELRRTVEKDGENEQESFNKYTCWCEKTLERKAKAITASKELIDETQILIDKLKGEIASHGSEIAQLKKDIAANTASQGDAASVRDKDHADYAEERSESEQCIGALEAAIKVLTGAGTKKGFLDTSAHTAQLLSVAAQVRTVFKFDKKSLPESVSDKDLDLVKDFVARPEEFLKAHASAMSAAQVGQNPFGDYAPQSTQIQGILKSMYDAFTADLEKDNAAEAESQKSFEELMATKLQEQKTLKGTLQQQESDQASKEVQLKENQLIKDDTFDQLEADETFFADTKEACQAKAEEWSIRTRLRTAELAGMQEAVKILSSQQAMKTFTASATTFFQAASVKRRHADVKKHHADNSGAQKAYGQLSKLATQYKNLDLARIAAAVQMGGAFDKVIGMIDDMVMLLRKEEAADIAHRERCQSSQNSNKNEIADLEHEIKKAEEGLGRLNNTKAELLDELGKLKIDINGTKANQKDLLDFRNDETSKFKQALKDDTEAVALIRQAIDALVKFYKSNKIPLELSQQAPKFAEDEDKAPKTTWSGSAYSGRRSESTGVVEILNMLAEDLETEMADARSDEADAQKKYEKQNEALQNTLDAQKATKVSLESQLAATDEKIDSTESFKTGKSKDKGAQDEMEKALATDCQWVESHFDSRRQKRKAEMQGLVDAKTYLAGVDEGDDVLPPLDTLEG